MRPTLASPEPALPSTLRATRSGASRKKSRARAVPGAKALAMELFDSGKNLFGVPFRLHFRKEFHELAVGTDEKCGPLNPNYLLAVHILFLENIKLFADYFVYICKEGVRQVVLILEFLLRLGRVARDTENDGSSLLYLLEYITKAAGFDGGAGSVSPGIEEKH